VHCPSREPQQLVDVSPGEGFRGGHIFNSAERQEIEVGG